MTTLPSSQQMFNGAAGAIEAFIDVPTPPAPYGIAVVTHPHPLQGGSALHKVPQALARCFQQNGWLAVRPNFRGVGGSDGAHDMGFGETEDVLEIVRALRADYPGAPLALAGFSFGAFVQARAASILNDLSSPPTHTILAGTPYGTIQGERRYETPTVPKDTLVIHGGSDSVVPLVNVMQWATPQRLPIVVLPGANHFLTGYLDTVIGLVKNRILTARLSSVDGNT
nr:alpha/beta fold hydrolase [Burkholderia cepacia]